MKLTLEKKQRRNGMDGSQITGTASSYARKYALNGLFCIDDTKDADTDEFKKQQEKEEKHENYIEDKTLITETQVKTLQALIKDTENPKGFYQEILDNYNIEKIEELNKNQFGEILLKYKEIKGGG